MSVVRKDTQCECVEFQCNDKSCLLVKLFRAQCLGILVLFELYFLLLCIVYTL